jgi:hypothetical protein
MQDEIFFIVITAIIACTIIVTTIVKSIFGIAKQKADLRSTSSGSSLTTSELERMLRQVVGEATDPLYERMEALEERLNAPMLEARRPDIELPDTSDDEVFPVSSRRQRS